MKTSHLHRSLPFVLLTLWLSLSGCDLFAPDRPEEARLNLQGAEGTVVLLVTSANFISQRAAIFENGVAIGDTLSVVLFESDTVEVALPFEQTYDISQFERFYAEIQRPEPATDLLYSRVWIDNDLRMDKRPLATEETVVFSYDFRIANGEDPNITL